VLHRDGWLLRLSGRGQMLARLPDGRALRLVRTVADITDRNLPEKHLRIGRERSPLV